MKRRWKKVCTAAVAGVCGAGLLAGCWDYRELEDRAIVVGIGIDQKPADRDSEDEKPRYQLIVQVVEPTQQGGGVGSGGQTQEVLNYSNFKLEAASISEGIERTILASDRMPNMAHLQVVVLGENVAKNGISELFDFLARYPPIRRQVEFIVVSDSVSRYFTTPSVSEPTPALHIASMVDTVQQTLNMLETNLGTISKTVRGNIPFFTLKAAINGENKIIMGNAAVFNKLKMVGTLSRNQMQDLSILHGEIDRGLLSFPCRSGETAGLQILNGKTKLKVQKGRPHITFQVELETLLMEYQCLGASLSTPDEIKKTERRFADMLKKRLLHTANELKDKYKKDLFKLTIRLKNYPDLYKELNEHPEQFFQRVTFDVNVVLKIRDIGNTLSPPAKRQGS